MLTGNLAPRGCVMKPAAAEQRFLKHRGKAIAFDDYNHMAREVERDDLDVTPDHVLVLKNAGPKGGPGMPEWGMLPIPKKLVKAGVRDMVRISDAPHERHELWRLHPACCAGELCRRAARLRADRRRDRSRCRGAQHPPAISEEELQSPPRRLAPPPPRYERGYGAMFSQHIGQADEGCDFDFLQGTAPTPEPEIH